MDQQARSALDQIRDKAPRYTGLDLTEKDIAAFRINNLLRGESDKRYGAFERKLCQLERVEREKQNIRVSETGYTIPPAVFRGTRNIIVGTDAAGGYLVDDNTVPVAFAEYLYAKSVVLPRATVLEDMKGALSVGIETGKMQVVWGAEVSEASESQSTFGNLALSPKELKIATHVSKFLMQQSDPSAENLTRMCMMAAFAEAFDTKILYGTGTNNEPAGLDQLPRIKNSPNTGRISLASDANVNRKKLTPALPLVGKANATGTGQLAWLIGWDLTERIQQTYGYIQDGKMFDIEAVSSSAVADQEAWLGNWDYLVAAIWGGVDIVIDRTSRMHKSQVRIIGHYRVDSGALHDDAFVQVTPMGA